MRQINSPNWTRKSGQQYLQKFRDLEQSSRKLDNKEADHNSEKDVIELRGVGGTAIITRPSSSDESQPSAEGVVVRLTGSATRKPQGGPRPEYVRTERFTEMTQQADVLEVKESSKSQLIDNGAWLTAGPGKADPKVVGEGSWERSFLVDLESGAIVSADPNLQSWFVF